MDQEKLDQLRAHLKSLESVAVAFSGGVDSTFLLFIAHEQLQTNCIAITARSCSFPEREQNEAEAFCANHGIEQVFVDNDELAIEGFADNPPNRCYLCKNELYRHIKTAAYEHGAKHIVEGSNLDDDGDYRPGRKALDEHGIISPLHAAGLTKTEIRKFSRELGLPSAGKPSFACLVTRFPYGECITVEGLARVDKAEQFLLEAGLVQVRVRSHGDVARIETDADGISAFAEDDFRQRVHDALVSFGFKFVALDLQGYRMGSMNATL